MAFSHKFLQNWPEISRINVEEHHPEILICCLPNKGLCTVKNGGHRTCPTFSFLVLKFKFKAELFSKHAN